MLARVFFILAVGGLTACSGGGSGSNPFGSLGSLNPFGGSGRAADGPVATREQALPGVLVDQLERVVPEPALRGLILRASGVTATQGYYGATLYPRNDGLPDAQGIITYEFRAVPPEVPGAVGPVQTRRLRAAVFLHDTELAGVRGFRVVSRGNSVDLRR